jgi:hypothetical protein
MAVMIALTVIIPAMPGTGSAGMALATIYSAAQIARSEIGIPKMRPRAFQVRFTGAVWSSVSDFEVVMLPPHLGKGFYHKGHKEHKRFLKRTFVFIVTFVVKKD